MRILTKNGFWVLVVATGLSSAMFAQSSGPPLYPTDPHPYQAQLDQMSATRDRDQAQLTNALANLERYTQLRKPGAARL